MPTWLGALVALIKIIPGLKDIVDKVIDFFVAEKIAAMKRENAEAIKEIGEKQDQTRAETALGSTSPGEESRIPGTEIRDSLPGVK